MRALLVTLLLILSACFAASHASTADGDVLAHGAADAASPAWALAVVTPKGWTRDCCTYARAIGVDAVLYRGEWSGKPQQVMVLNVSVRKLSTLAAEVQADRTRYRQRDPTAKVSGFIVRNPTMPCEATVYQGSDHVDDVVVFCDPGQSSGVRVSWSMALDATDPATRTLLDDFMRVVVDSRYQRYVSTPAHGA